MAFDFQPVDAETSEEFDFQPVDQTEDRPLARAGLKKRADLTDDTDVLPPEAPAKSRLPDGITEEDAAMPWDQLTPEKKAIMTGHLNGEIAGLAADQNRKNALFKEEGRSADAIDQMNREGKYQTEQRIERGMHILPLYGVAGAAEEGMKSGKEFLGDNVAGKAAGVGLATLNALGTAANPIMYGGRKLAQGAQIAGEAAAGDTSNAIDILDEKQGVMDWLTPEGTLTMQAAKKWNDVFGGDASENTTVQTIADLEEQLRKDPANSVLILEGVGKLGVQGYARRLGRLGEPLNPTIAKLFPEAVDAHAEADTARINQILNDKRKAAGAGGPLQGPADLRPSKYLLPEIPDEKAGTPNIPVDLRPVDLRPEEQPVAEPVKTTPPTGKMAQTEFDLQPVEEPMGPPSRDASYFKDWAREQTVGKLKQLREDHVDDPQAHSVETIRFIDEVLKEKSLAEQPPVAEVVPTNEQVQPTEPAVQEPKVVSDSEPTGPDQGRGVAGADADRRARATDRIQRSGRILGVDQVEIGGDVSDSGINNNGWVRIRISKDHFDGLLSDDPNVVAHSEAVISEELGHAAGQIKLGEDWKKAVESGDKRTAGQFSRDYHKEVWNDVKKTIGEWNDTGNSNLSERIKQVLFDSWNAYRNNGADSPLASDRALESLSRKTKIPPDVKTRLDAISKVKTPDDLMAHLEAHPEGVNTLVGEFVRQLQQMKDSGKVTEYEYYKIFQSELGKAFIDWIKKSFDALRDAVGDVEKGVYGEMMKKALADTGEILKRLDQEGVVNLTEEEIGDIHRISDEELARADREAAGGGEAYSLEAKGKDKKKIENFGLNDEPTAKPEKVTPTRTEPTPFRVLSIEHPSADSVARRLTMDVLAEQAGEPVISSTASRIAKGWGVVRESAVETLRKAGGALATMASRIEEYYDERSALIGQLSSWAQDVVDRIPKAMIKDTFAQFEEYMKLREGAYSDIEDATKVGPERRALLADIRRKGSERAAEYYKSMNPHARELVHVVERIFEHTGIRNEKVGFMNQDPETGKWRPIGNYGKFYWPKIMKDSVRRVLENPAKYPKEFQDMMQQIMKRNGLQTIAQAKQFMHEMGVMERENANIMGNLKFARTHFLPDSFYEYDFNKTIPTFIARWADEVSKAEQFGHDYKGFEEKNIFKTFKSTDKATGQYIDALYEAIYGHKRTRMRDLIINPARVYTTMTKLANPLTSIRNLGTVFTNTASEFGVSAALKASGKLLLDYANQIREAQKSGALKHDFINAEAEVWDLTEYQRAATTAALKYGGFTATEKFTRVHAAATAIQWARWALGVIDKNPNSRSAMLARHKFNQFGVDIQRLGQEGFDGQQARKLMRVAAEKTQFTYDLRQVPLWMETPEAKFFFQFKKFGVQALNRLDHDVIRPAVFGHQVEYNEKLYNIRDFKPLLITAAAAVGVGEVMTATINAAMGKQRTDPSWSEIAGSVEDKKVGKAAQYLAERVANDMVLMGVWGTLGDSYKQAESFLRRGQVPEFAVPPAMDSLHNLIDATIVTIQQQGKITGRDIMRLVEQELPAMKIVHRLWDVGSQSEVPKAKTKLSRIRALGYRFQSEEGLKKSAQITNYGKTENTADYMDLQEALMTGNVNEASRLKEKILAKHKPGSDREKARKGMQSSVSARQPFKVGNIDSQAEKQAFKAWMLRRVGEEEFADLRQIDETYQRTAAKLGLMKETHIGTVESAKQYNKNREFKQRQDVNSAISQ